jgi:hypothetical protein
MKVNAEEMMSLLKDLAIKKSFFCSEMDFQLHLAWEMKQRNWELALEYDPQCFDANAAIDILVHKPERVAIELKYKTALFTGEASGQSLTLKSQAAQDVARYDFHKDIWRIEQVVAKGQAECGFAIFLTNDGGYWREGRNGTADEMFRMFEGRSVSSGPLQWGPHTSDGTMRGREMAISLTRDYVFGWKEYADLRKKNGVFRYLIVEIKPSTLPYSGNPGH